MAAIDLINWTLLDGAKFESLVQTVLSFEYPDIEKFDRLGPDFGQDAASTDGTRVYQAKYGRRMTMVEACRLARCELEKIRGYLSAPYESEKHRLWAKVKEWTLVCNAEINPGDMLLWRRRVEEAFSDLNISLVFWGSADLKSLLSKYPDVVVSYFGGENRCFVSLGEAYEMFGHSGAGGLSLDLIRFESREIELSRACEFVDSATEQVLLVSGDSLVGKTRFLFEIGRVQQELGRRVFWGLPETMGAGSSWLRGVPASTTPSLLVVDDVSDVHLLARISEQLSTPHFRGWKVIICASRGFQRTAERLLRQTCGCLPLELNPFSEECSERFVINTSAQLNVQISRREQESVAHWAKGLPGLMVYVLKHGFVSGGRFVLGVGVVEYVNGRIEKALAQFDESLNNKLQSLLRWIAVLKVVVVDAQDKGFSRFFQFLVSELKVQQEELLRLLELLKENGLVATWGQRRKYFMVKPELAREAVVGNWLYEKAANGYEPSVSASQLIKRIVNGEIPFVDVLIENIASLSSQYLTESCRAKFLHELFDSMRIAAEESSVEIQLSECLLLQKIGYVDILGSIAVINSILSHRKESKVIKDEWGEATICVEDVWNELPWLVYKLSLSCDSALTAKRLWNIFLKLCDEETAESISPVKGKRASELILRLLRDVNVSEMFQPIACEAIRSDLAGTRFGVLCSLLSEGILSPIRETVESGAFRRIRIDRRYLIPGGEPWKLSLKVRDELFTAVSSVSFAEEDCVRLWNALEQGHYSFRCQATMADIQAEHKLAYSRVNLSDLEKTKHVLSDRIQSMSIRELLAARNLWSTALEYGDAAEKAIALECEALFQSREEWRFNDFFKWERFQETDPAVLEIKEKFAQAASVEYIERFFDAASEFLLAKDPSKPCADCGLMWLLAKVCVDLYAKEGSRFHAFVDASLRMPLSENRLRDEFLFGFVRLWLFDFRKTHDEVDVSAEVSRLFSLISDVGAFLVAVYSGMPERVLGKLTKYEFKFFVSKMESLTAEQSVKVAPSFLTIDFEGVKNLIADLFAGCHDNISEASTLWGTLMTYSYLCVLRNESPKEYNPICWLMDLFVKYSVDGALLSDSGFWYLVDKGKYRMSQTAFVEFIKNRCVLDGRIPRPYERFEVLPHDFEVSRLVQSTPDAASIRALCKMSFDGETYTAGCRVPTYLASLDSEAVNVSSYVVEVLGSPDLSRRDLYRLACLAESYEENSVGWNAIVRPICAYLIESRLTRAEINSVYRGFQKKFSIWSSAYGEVPHCFEERVRTTKERLDAEPYTSALYEYRKWTYEMALSELDEAKERAEGERNE